MGIRHDLFYIIPTAAKVLKLFAAMAACRFCCCNIYPVRPTNQPTNPPPSLVAAFAKSTKFVSLSRWVLCTLYKQSALLYHAANWHSRNCCYSSPTHSGPQKISVHAYLYRAEVVVQRERWKEILNARIRMYQI